MEKTNEILKYLFVKYPKSNELSYTRVMKLFYLIEWKFAITNFKKITDISWIKTKYGPFYSDLIKVFEESNDFSVYSKIENDNSTQIILKFLNSNKEIIHLQDETKVIINFVIEHCKDLTWSELNNIVNSTYAVINSELNSEIELLKLAKKYKNQI